MLLNLARVRPQPPQRRIQLRPQRCFLLSRRCSRIARNSLEMGALRRDLVIKARCNAALLFQGVLERALKGDEAAQKGFLVMRLQAGLAGAAMCSAGERLQLLAKGHVRLGVQGRCLDTRAGIRDSEAQLRHWSAHMN